MKRLLAINIALSVLFALSILMVAPNNQATAAQGTQAWEKLNYGDDLYSLPDY